jgi:hypothetical protein
MARALLVASRRLRGVMEGPMKNSLGKAVVLGAMGCLAAGGLGGCGAGDPGDGIDVDGDDALAVGEAESALPLGETKVLPAFGVEQGFHGQHPRLVGNFDSDTDVDIVAFGEQDISISRSNGDGTFTTPVSPTAIDGFGCFDQGWRVETDERLMSDIDNDGDMDLVFFGDGGAYTMKAEGNSYLARQWLMTEFGGQQAWRKERHVRVVANVDSTPEKDFIGFFNDGVYVSRNLGANSLGDWEYTYPVKVIGNNMFGYNGGWRVDKHPRYVVDITGDNCADIVGFGDAGVWTAVSSCDGSFHPFGFVLAQYGANAGAGGWISADYPRLMGDINQDGKADIIGFAESGVWVSLATGNGLFAAGSQVIPGFGTWGGWYASNTIRTLHDVDGDGDMDVVGFGPDGVYVAEAAGGTLTPALLVSYHWGANAAAGGWSSPILYPRFVGHVDGDGILDVIGFANDGTYAGGLQL